jgi:hypothetical protein
VPIEDAGRLLPQQNPGYQVAAEDERDVDSDDTAGEARHAEMANRDDRGLRPVSGADRDINPVGSGRR